MPVVQGSSFQRRRTDRQEGILGFKIVGGVFYGVGVKGTKDHEANDSLTVISRMSLIWPICPDKAEFSYAIAVKEDLGTEVSTEEGWRRAYGFYSKGSHMQRPQLHGSN